MTTVGILGTTHEVYCDDCRQAAHRALSGLSLLGKRESNKTYIPKYKNTPTTSLLGCSLTSLVFVAVRRFQRWTYSIA